MSKVTLALQALKVSKVPLALQALKVHKVVKVSKVPLALQALKVSKVLLALQVLKVHKVVKVLVDLQAHKVFKVLQVLELKVMLTLLSNHWVSVLQQLVCRVKSKPSVILQHTLLLTVDSKKIFEQLKMHLN